MLMSDSTTYLPVLGVPDPWGREARLSRDRDLSGGRRRMAGAAGTGQDGPVTTPTTRPVTDPLSIAALETERHVAAGGWDQPVRLFALVETAHLLEHEPGFLDTLQPHDVAPGALTAVEQDDLPSSGHLETMLAQVMWPDTVVGAAIAVERIVVPPAAERDLPMDPDEALAVLAGHPDRKDVRLLVAVLRDGTSRCLLRQRDHDRDDRVAQGEEIAPGLVHGLLATFDPAPDEDSGASEA